MNRPEGVAVAPDGTVYIADTYNFVVRRITTDGIIETIAGIPGTRPINCATDPGAAGCPSRTPAAAFDLEDLISDIAVLPNGELLIANGNNNARVVFRTLPGPPQRLGIAFSLGASSGGSAYDFSTAGRHLRTRDAVTGAVTTGLQYGPNGLLDALTDAHGDMTLIERDTAGVPTAIVAPDGQRTTLSMDPNGFLSGVANPLSEDFAMDYTPTGLLESFTDPEVESSTMLYDGEGRLQLDTNAEFGLWDITRTPYPDALGYQVGLRSAENRTTTHSVRQRSTGGSDRSSTYPTGDIVATSETPDGKTSTTAPDGTLTVRTDRPDPRFGMLSPVSDIEVTLPSSLKLTSTVRRTLTPVDPNQALLSFDETRTINGRNYRSQYTGATRVWTLTSPQGRTRSMTVNAQGLPTDVAVPGLNSVSYNYDPRGRLIGIAAGNGALRRETTLGYDSYGFVDLVNDAENRATGFDNDAIGRAQTQTLPDARQIDFSYDRRGSVTGITPPARPQHAFGYNRIAQMNRYTPPSVANGGATTYGYNLDRQLDFVARPDGAFIDPSYQANGRLDFVATPLGSYSYTYTSGSRVQSLTAPGGVGHSYLWDGPLLKTHTVSGPVAGSVAYTYDANFWVDTVSVAAKTLDFGYDNDGLLTSAALTGSPTLSLARNAQNGLLTGTTLASVTDTWTYNGFAEPLSYEAKETGVTHFAQTFERDKLGRITKKTETILGNTSVILYTYDSAGRLDTVTTDSLPSADYGYDDNGNRNALTGAAAGIVGGCFDGSVAFSASYDAQDRMTDYGACSYQYTAHGDLTEKRQAMGLLPEQVTAYNYDVFGNLRSATLPDATEIEYLVDGLNRRIGKKVNGALVQGFLYLNQLEPIAELDGTGTVIATFLHAERGHVPSVLQKGASTYRIVADHLGSVRLVIDSATGAIAQRMDYDEFGNVTLDTNPGFQPFGFAGGIYDRDTGLTRYGARDYDPSTGRWTAKDPIRFRGGDTNLFAYVGGDPINRIDPRGTWIVPAVAAALIAYALWDDISDVFDAEEENWDSRNILDSIHRTQQEIRQCPDDDFDRLVELHDRLNNLRAQWPKEYIEALGAEYEAVEGLVAPDLGTAGKQILKHGPPLPWEVP